jgi:hypothetical protein
LRLSLSNWLVNKAKVAPKTVQGILRHSRIQTTLDLYTQEDSEEARAAQGESPVGARDELGAGAMKMWAGLWVEVLRLLAANPLKEMVGTRRLELLTSTVSTSRLRISRT